MAHRSAIDDSASLLRHLVGATVFGRPLAPGPGLSVRAEARELDPRIGARPAGQGPQGGARERLAHDGVPVAEDVGPDVGRGGEGTPVDRRRIANDVEDVDDGHVIG